MADIETGLVFGEDDVILPTDWDESATNYQVDDPEAFAAPAGETTPTTEEVTESNVEAEQVTEEVTEVPPTTEEVPEASAPTVKVKYNHEDRELSLDEAAVLAQKGLNYDKLDERVRSYEAMRNRNITLAKRLGYDSEEEMIEAAETNFRNRKIRELVDAGNTEAMAKFLVEQELGKATSPAPAPTSRQATPTPAANGSGLTAERKAELDEFVRTFPGITKLPDEVIAANRNGVRLSLAYERYQNKVANQDKDRELAILKQNQAAAAKAPVVGATGNSPTSAQQKTDYFLKGFDSDENYY